MKSTVFMSHANADKTKCQQLYDMLRHRGIEVWASFRDIPPGEEWDQSIQDALDQASHVLLVVSTKSIESSYVRAEIEYALDNKKVVIPILIEQVKLPVRWHTLQFVDWTQGYDEALEALGSQLPRNSVRQLQELLANKSDSDLVRQLIFDNWQWINLGALSHLQLIQLSDQDFPPKLGVGEHEYSYRTIEKLHGLYNPLQLTTASFVVLYDLQEMMLSTDFVASPYDASSGRLVEIVFLCSPYKPFIRSNGAYSVEFQEHLSHAEQIAVEIDKKRRMTFIQARVISGQRDDYDDQINTLREELRKSWVTEVSNKFINKTELRLDIESFTRLLNTIYKV